MATISPKQIGMAWINSKLDPQKINPEDEELQVFNGGKPLTEDKLAKAKQFIYEDLAKVKIRYQKYTEKYVGDTNVDSPENEKDETPEERDESSDLSS